MHGRVFDGGIGPDYFSIEIKAGCSHVAKVNIQAPAGDNRSGARLGVLAVRSRRLTFDAHNLLSPNFAAIGGTDAEGDEY